MPPLLGALKAVGGQAAVLWAVPLSLTLSIAIVGDFQPVLYFVVDVRYRLEWYPVRDAVLLGKAAGVNQPARWFHVSQSEAYVDSLGRSPLP